MTSYPTKYLFIAETQGTKQAAAELNALYAAMRKMNTAQGGAGSGGGSSAFGPGKSAASEWDGLSGYVDKFGQRMRSALAYSIAFGAIGATFGAIAATTRTWVDAQVELNEVIANTSILLGRSAQEGMQFANTQRALAFATGQDLSEIAPASMMAARVGQPGLATSAAQWSMVVGPELNASETVDDLRALSIQFDLSMEQINNGLLATLQNSGIAADQLFDLSASFGVFAGQLGLGETETDLREIAGLFAALSNITGQTTPTLQNFMRRMADEFYDPNAALRQQLNAAGIQTVSQGPATVSRDMFGNVTKVTEEIRRPFTEIFAEIAQKGPAAIAAFSTAIDNSLGQPTQSQFILVAENWAKVADTLKSVSNSTAEFSDAVDTAADKTSTGLGQIGTAIQNLASAIGDGEGFASAVRTIASAIQNVYDKAREPDIGFSRLSTQNQGAIYSSAGYMETRLEGAYQDTSITERAQRRLAEILAVMEVPSGFNFAQQSFYTQSAVNQFSKSRYADPGDNAVIGAQQFQEFMRSPDFDMAAALKSALGSAFSGEQIAGMFSSFLTETERAALGLKPLGEEANIVASNLSATGGPLEMFMSAISNGSAPVEDLRQAWIAAASSGRDVEAAMGPLAGGASYAEGELVNLAGAAAGAAGAMMSFQSLKQFRLPEGYDLSDLDRFYGQAGQIISGFNQGNDITPFERGKLGPVGVTDQFGVPLGAPNYAEEQAQLAINLMQQDKTIKEKALSEQKSYQSKALSSQEAYQNKMLGNWNGMINDLLKPSAVTGTDLFYNSQNGTYNDNWDEPVRQMKADINNALAGKPLEYGYGGLTPYMNMDAINAAMGMDQASKEGILRSEEAGVSERFYNMELPWEAYSGNTDSIIANAQAWIAGKQQKNANMANVQQLLIDAGLGPDAEAFVKAMEEPPILRSLFGGKSADEINTTVTEAVTPDMGKALTEQVANTPWSLTISGAIQKDVTNNYEVIVSAGMAIGKGLAEGSASMFAAAIIPLVLAAIVGRE